MTTAAYTMSDRTEQALAALEEAFDLLIDAAPALVKLAKLADEVDRGNVSRKRMWEIFRERRAALNELDAAEARP